MSAVVITVNLDVGSKGEVRRDHKVSGPRDSLDGASMTGNRRKSKFETGEAEGDLLWQY